MNPIHPRLVVLMEDPLVHTDEQPTCLDPHCPCQQDAQTARQAIQAPVEPQAIALAQKSEERAQ